MIMTATGGAKGGGAKLTPLGKTVVARFRAIEAQARRASQAELTELLEATSSAAADPGSLPSSKKPDTSQR